MALRKIPQQSDLLTEVAKGNERAFEDLFGHYHNQIGEYVMLLTHSIEMTEEIVQDIFLKIWTNRSSLSEIQDFNAYLFILTRNYTLNALRKTSNDQRRQALYLVEEAEKESLSPSLVDSVYQNEDFDVLLEKAIIQLPPQQQKVFLLRMQGFKHSEIALKMNLATGSVKKYQKWALIVLKKQLQPLPEVVMVVFIYFPDIFIK